MSLCWSLGALLAGPCLCSCAPGLEHPESQAASVSLESPPCPTSYPSGWDGGCSWALEESDHSGSGPNTSCRPLTTISYRGQTTEPRRQQQDVALHPQCCRDVILMWLLAPKRGWSCIQRTITLHGSNNPSPAPQCEQEERHRDRHGELCSLVNSSTCFFF